MTKEELKQEAEGYTNKLLEDWELYDPEALQEAYIAGAEPKEKRNAELEAQIEKMKCCQNCSHLCSRCELGIDGCYVCSKWEIKGNDR